MAEQRREKAPAKVIGASDPILQRMADEDPVPWYKKPNLRYLYFMLLPTCMGIESTSGFDSQLINALQIVPTWQEFFNNPVDTKLGGINSAYSGGAILSLPFVPLINDRFGRRWSIFIGSCVMCVGAIIQTCAQNLGMYIFARMVLGFGIPVCIVAGSSLIGELGYPKERPVLTSFFNVAYFLGQVLAAGVCFGTNNIASSWGWRLPSLLQIVPSLIQISFIFFIPESPRWLVSKDRHEEAHEILIKYHAEGDRDSEFVRAEMAQIRATISIEMEASKKSWKDLISTSGMRRRLLITCMLGLFTQWSGNTLISYYLGTILSMIGKTNSIFKQKLNLGLSCWALVVGTIAGLCVGRFRRRTMYLIGTCSLFLVYVSWTTSMAKAMEAVEKDSINTAAGISVIVFIFLYSPAYNTCYNALTYTYLVELWPFAERNRGISFYQLASRSAAFFTTFINPIGLNRAGWKYFLSYCCFLLYEIAFVYFMFPETFGRTLEELAFIFEDKELADRAVMAVEKAIHHEDMPEKNATTQEVVEDVHKTPKV